MAAYNPATNTIDSGTTMTPFLAAQAQTAANQGKPGYDVLGKPTVAAPIDKVVPYNPLTAFNQSMVNNQSTTTLSSDKTKDIGNIQNTTNNLAQTGVTTDTNTGIATNADSSVYTPHESPEPADAPENGISNGAYVGDIYYPPGAELPKDNTGNYFQTTATSPTDDKILASLNDQKSQTDALTASIITSIQAQYAQLIKQQEQVNAAQKGGETKLLLRNGGLQHTGSGQNVLSATVSYGISQLADLNNKEQMAILQAQQAGQQQDFQLQDKINQEISSIRDKKVEAATKLNDQIAAANQKLAEDQKKNDELKAQVNTENLIGNFVSQGITDPTQIMNLLNENGNGTTTLKQIDDALKIVNPSPDMAGLSPDYRTFLALQKTDPKIKNMGWLDYQRAVTNATTKVTNTGGGNGNVSSTTQAVIDNPSLFDDLTPTLRGQVISELQMHGYSTTNLGVKSLSDTAITKLADMQSAISNLNDLKTKIAGNEDKLGPVIGLERFNPYSDAKKLQADVDRIRQQVGKTLEGGVLRKEDEEKYKQILATLADTPETATYKVDALISSLQRDMENYKSLQQSAGKSANVNAPLTSENDSSVKVEDLRNKYDY